MIAATLARLGLVAKPENAWQGSGWRLAALSLNEFGSCVLLVAIPIVLSIINSSWLYTAISWLDPWYNVGYFLHYSDPNFLSTYYKIARLSWIIPGFAAYHVFPPLVANYLLHMGCLLVAIVFFFLAVSRLFDSSIAFAAAVCFAIFVPFHGSGGWDYQTAPAGAYYIAAFYFLTVAAESTRMRVPLIVAGAAYACAVHATLSFVNFAPLLAAHFTVLYRRQFTKLPSWGTLWRAGLWFIFGAFAVTALLGTINVAVGRDFLFFKILLQFVIDLERSQSQLQWWLPWSSGWFLKFPSLYYMASLFASLIVCAGSATLGLIARRDSVALSLQLQYVFAGALWMIWQSLGQLALQPDYPAYPLYPV